MKKWLTQAKTDLSGQISRNGNFFTIAAIVFILITGTNLASGNKNWWQSSLAILVVLGLVFSFLQARVVLKALATILIAALTSQMALQSGIIFNAKSSIGLVWMLNQFLLLFLCLAISYLSIGSRSRWTATWVGLIASSLISVSKLQTCPNTHGRMKWPKRWRLIVMLKDGAIEFLSEKPRVVKTPLKKRSWHGMTSRLSCSIQ